MPCINELRGLDTLGRLSVVKGVPSSCLLPFLKKGSTLKEKYFVENKFFPFRVHTFQKETKKKKKMECILVHSKFLIALTY